MNGQSGGKVGAECANLVKCSLVQFPPETVREIAQLLTESDLGEISFEIGSGQKISLKRKPKFVGIAAPAFEVQVAATEESLAIAEAPAASDETDNSDAILIASPCVGVFHAAREAVEVGAKVKAKQLVGTVESLKVPNEIYAGAEGVVSQMWVSDGQGVEWGQPLFEIAPAS